MDVDDDIAGLLEHQLGFIRQHVPHDLVTDSELVELRARANVDSYALRLSSDRARCQWALLVVLTSGQALDDDNLKMLIALAPQPDDVVDALYRRLS